MSEGNSGGGNNFLGLLTLLFVGLKLGKVIDWSWWLVLSPILIEALLIAVLLVVGLVCIWMDRRTS